MSNYWAFRTYKHQQGSLVWKANRVDILSKHLKIRWFFWYASFPLTINSKCSFKVID